MVVTMNTYNPDFQLVKELSLPNCRELGGMPLAGGKTFKSGLFLRASSPHRLDNEGITKLKEYGIKDSCLKKWIRANPHYNLYKSIFNEDWIKEEGDWISRVIKYINGEEIFYQYDCHELIEGMF